MIKVLSGWGGPGGSTVAFSNLVNLFNKYDSPACFYTPTKWEGISCKWDGLDNLKLSNEDVLIYHFMELTVRPPVKKIVLSCHETNLFPLKEKKHLAHDDIVFVSEFQKHWHDVDGVVIPNVITEYKKGNIKNYNKTAGIIGSIDPHKGVHDSINRALSSKDVSEVIIYGAITDRNYFESKVAPLLSPKVSYRGVSTDMQSVYDEVDVVYSSSKRECLPMIQGECLKMGMEYRGLDHNTRDPSDYESNDEIILEKWKTCLEL